MTADRAMALAAYFELQDRHDAAYFAGDYEVTLLYAELIEAVKTRAAGILNGTA